MKIIRLEFRNLYKSLLFWIISIGSIIFLMLAFFPNMQSESMQQLARAKMEGMDPAILAAFGLEVLPDFTNVTEYFGYIFQYITLAIMIFVTQKSISLLIREETDGTIEFLYGNPVSRMDIFFQKLLALIMSYVFFLMVLSGVTLLGYVTFSDKGIAESIKEIVTMFSGVFYAGMVFLCVGILISTVIKSDKSSFTAANAIVFGTYVLGIMSVLIKKLDFLRYASPMDWIKTDKLLKTGISGWEWGIGISVILFSIISASILYERKDMKI